jgi:peptide/nickel transport system substrate-binding protein
MVSDQVPIDRRAFLKVAAASAVAVGLAACGPEAPAPTAAPAATQAPAPTEAPAARVMRIATWESGGVKETMDPAFNYQDSDASRVGLVYDRLFRVDSGFTPQPELALEWSSNDTADVWTIALRQGVKFHNGKDFTAADVVYTYKRLLDPAVGSAAAASLTAITADGIEAVDPYTVRFSLPEPVVDLPLVISTRHTFIVPDGSTSEELQLMGIGTGPFRQVEFTPGELRAVFEKNPDYWEPGLPKVDGIELISISEGAARNAALQSGEIDLAMVVDLGGLSALEGDSNVKVISARSPYVIDMCSWCDTPPFDDVKVRQAIKYCLDRDVIVQTVALGHASMANDHPVAPWVRYAWDVEPRGQDYEKAKQLLKEAGHENGLDLELYTGDASPGMVALAQVFKEMAAPAGINVEVIQSPADTYWSEVWMQKPFACGSWSGRPADEALFIAYYSKAEWNESHFYNEEFDNALLTARQTLDEAERTALYQKAQQILSEQGGTYIPLFLDSLAASRSNVEGWEPHPTNYVKDFRNIAFTA